ncbi:hypothetical protein COT08_00110 [Candidatus Woesebacteria bacterium CG07_land_8_20_14_0_80_44_9]|uniref:Uncharacterized protein n=1 Tax=Candidatus Woesebacteria bacterium CG07_land_8_20_14_0_80_44_9 TaxID=1975058 RepID=A0A2M6YFD4_9BACT|nr:MAG: hypothetical protein COT08_00110 [Candidatus Woesebacteria bacterium CG07_land_8_20_14_0_80_44_9]
MPKLNKISWGKVKVDGKDFHQVLIVGGKVIERDKQKLETLFSTTHKIGDWEQKLLLSENPEIILVASGWSGILKIEEEFKNRVVKQGAELKVVLTPMVVGEYNRLVTEGKRVNCLVHTTC